MDEKCLPDFLICAGFVEGDSSCDDGEQNGDEEGVDCGGSCATACEEAGPPLPDSFSEQDMFCRRGGGRGGGGSSVFQEKKLRRVPEALEKLSIF